MNARTLFRYNFRVLMTGNWWLLVFPIAASQLSVFWALITQRTNPTLPAMSAELISPLIAAFLSAHLLSAEYQSNIGSIVASKPVDIGKVVAMRLMVVFALVWALGLLSLVAFYFGMAPYDILTTALAGLPSTLFLALLSLTFATLFRHPLAGFGVAALFWILDLPPGTPIHPVLSLRTYTSDLATADRSVLPLIAPWWLAKPVLLALAAGLYWLHSRLIFTLGTVHAAKLRRRALWWSAALLCGYLITGAVAKVGYGLAHRGALPQDDAAWFRQQFAPFGPIPVDRLFGPAFPRYLGEIPNVWRLQQEGEADRWGDTLRHRHQLREVVSRMPDSMWAPASAELLARLESRHLQNPDESAALYRRVPDRYPESPYVAFALRQIGHGYSEANQVDKARAAYEELLHKRPGSPYESEALRFLIGPGIRRDDLAGAEALARRWTAVAPVQEKFVAYAALAEIRRDRGDSAGAKDAARQTITAVKAFHAAEAAGKLPTGSGAQVKWDREANEAESKARAIGAGP